MEQRPAGGAPVPGPLRSARGIVVGRPGYPVRDIQPDAQTGTQPEVQPATRPDAPSSPEPDGAVRSSGGTGYIVAAGAVVWRVGQNGLEVLLVHRPRYEDWSWPKGKLEPGESLPAAAVREVQEETGLRVALGRPLPSAHYRFSEMTEKSVHYWAAAGPPGPPPQPPRPAEVDRLLWASASQADQMLTRRADRVQLTAVLAAHETRTLVTFPLVVLRHGHARPKSAWGREDQERPLVEVGHAQASMLAGTLGAFAVRKVLSSPWRRCVQTLEPFVQASGRRLRTKTWLSEDGHRRDRGKTAALVAKYLGKGKAVVLCTHRPVLGTVLGVLAGHAEVGRAASLPSKDPFLNPGELLVAHVARSTGRVVAVERHPC